MNISIAHNPLPGYKTDGIEYSVMVGIYQNASEKNAYYINRLCSDVEIFSE